MRRRTLTPDNRGRDWSARRVGGIGCAVFLVAAVGFVAGRAAGAPGLAPAQPPVSAPPISTPHMAETGEGSPLVDGIPVGFTDDQTGAVAAATAFSRALGGPLLLDPTAYERAVETIAAPGQGTTLSQAASQQLTALDQSYHLVSLARAGVPVSVTTVPLSYDVEAFTPHAATVAIWAVGVMAAAGHLVPTAVWTTFEYQLTWTGDWRLQAISILDAGWAPAEVQPTPATSDVPGQLGAYRRYPDAPG